MIDERFGAQRRDSRAQDERKSVAEPSVGKTTLTQGLDARTDAAVEPSLFDGAAWESVDPVEEQLAHLDATTAAADGEHDAGEADAAGEDRAIDDQHGADEDDGEEGADAEEVAAALSAARTEGDDIEDDDDAGDDEPTSDNTAPRATASRSEELEPEEATTPVARIASAGFPEPRGKAHGKPYETKLRKARKGKQLWAKQDRYNVRSVKSNNSKPKRPGPKGYFQLKPEGSDRYRITTGSTATAVDHVHGGAPLALNPARSRPLKIPGRKGKPTCVLAWYSTQGSAWLPADAFAAGAGTVTSKINKLAKRWAPEDARGKTKQFKFRAAGSEIAKPDAYDVKSHILKQRVGSTGNNTEDYLERPRQRVGQGDTIAQAAYYNVCMNLPQSDAPPVASDIAHPGDRFFVLQGATFRRSVSIFEPGKSTSNRVQTWVYGFVGTKAGKRWVPDHSRRGWVPLRVLTR